MGASDKPTGLSQAEPEGVSAVPASIPRAGEWAVIRASYGHPRVHQIAKVTPKLVKFDGPNWPRQASLGDVLASLPDEETARMVSSSLAGAGGQREARIRKAREDFETRRAAAWDAYEKVSVRIIAKARGEA